MGVSGQRYAPAELYPENWSPVPIIQEAVWASEPVWTQTPEEKSFASAGEQTLITQQTNAWSDTILTVLPGSLVCTLVTDQETSWYIPHDQNSK
jgi:hypothetical protein